MASFVLTVLGQDHPGLVDELAGLVSRHGGNWERSHMARLGGKFAGIVEIAVGDDRSDRLRDELSAFGERTGMSVRVDDAGAEMTLGGRRVTVELVGTDRPGLVHSVSAALAAVGANIEELSTKTSSAPMSGGLLFEATVTAALPTDVEIDAVRQRLEALADRLMVDIELSD